MKWTKPIRRGTRALALGAACLAGCQQFNRSPALSSLSPAWDGGRQVTSRQAADVQVALGRTFEQQGELGQAVATYEEAVKRDPRRTDALVRLGILCDQQGKFRESADWYRRALQSSPGNPNIYCNMGYSLYLQRRWAEAEMNLQQALALKPDLARARNNLALVLAHTDRVDQALAEFRKTGSEWEARVNLALALTMDQHWAEAREQYLAALAANPSSEAAKNGLRQLDALVAQMTPTAPRSSGPERAPAEPAVEVVKQEQTVEAAKVRPDALPPAAPEFSTPALSLPRADPVVKSEPIVEASAQEAVPEKPGLRLSQARTFFHLEGQESPAGSSGWSSHQDP